MVPVYVSMLNAMNRTFVKILVALAWLYVIYLAVLFVAIGYGLEGGFLVLAAFIISDYRKKKGD